MKVNWIQVIQLIYIEPILAQTKSMLKKKKKINEQKSRVEQQPPVSLLSLYYAAHSVLTIQRKNMALKHGQVKTKFNSNMYPIYFL